MSACFVAVLPRDADATFAHRLRHALGGALALLTVASLGILLSRTLELNGHVWPTLWPDVRLALVATHFGHVWWWRVPALAVAWLAWTQLARRRGAWPGGVLLLALAAIALTRSETGHPADAGDFTLAVWIDCLHQLAAGAWVGSLFGMSLAVFPLLLRRREAHAGLDAQIFQRLSTLCGVALAVLVACGVFNASRQLGGFAALWTTRYGMILDVKLALVLVMILIGAHNRYFKLPRLHAAAAGHAPGQAILRASARAVLIESVLGLAVIGATATLLHAMPPADAPMPHAMSMAASAASAPEIAGPANVR